MFNNLRNEHFVLFLRILLIQNAVGPMLDPYAPKTVCSGEDTLVAVEEIVGAIPTVTAKGETIEVHSACLTFVHALCLLSPDEVVHAVLGGANEVAVAAISATAETEGVRAVFGFVDVIPGNILILLTGKGLARMLQFPFLKLCTCCFQVIGIAEIKSAHRFLVLLLRELLIEETVLLLAESCAPEAVRAATAIVEEGAVTALRAELAPEEVKTLVAVDAFIAELTAENFEAIDTGPGIENPVAKHRILILIGFDREVAILGKANLVHILAILDTNDTESEKRHIEQELMELIEERTREIKISPIVERTPFSAVPCVVVIRLVRTVGSDNRGNPLLREVARAEIEVALHPPGKSALETAWGAESRFRECKCLSAKLRREFREHCTIFVCDDKRNFAVIAGSGHLKRILRQ